MEVRKIVLTILIGFTLFIYANYCAQEFNPSEIGLGKNTTSHKSSHNGILRSAIGANIDTVLTNMLERKKLSSGKIALWIGNSQLHAINLFKAGDKLAIDYLSENIDSLQRGIEVFQISSPHLNILEELVYLSELNNKDILPDILIIPITFRSFHFNSIRNKFKGLEGYSNVEKIIKREKVVDFFSYEKSLEKKKNASVKNETPQDITENIIETELIKRVPYFSERKNTKSFIKYLPKWLIHKVSPKRNNVGIGLKDNIELSCDALKDLIAFSNNNGITLLFYHVPHPQSPNSFFYDMESYKGFKKKVDRIIQENTTVSVHDLSQTIPDNLWGLNNDGNKDIYHFQSKGHKMLGNQITQILTATPEQ